MKEEAFQAVEAFRRVWSETRGGKPVPEGPLRREIDDPELYDAVRAVAEQFGFRLWRSPNDRIWLLPEPENEFVELSEYDMSQHAPSGTGQDRARDRALMSYFACFVYYTLLGSEEYGGTQRDFVLLSDLVELFDRHLRAYLDEEEADGEACSADFRAIAAHWSQLDGDDPGTRKYDWTQSKRGFVRKALLRLENTNLVTVHEVKDDDAVAPTEKLLELKEYITSAEATTRVYEKFAQRADRTAGEERTGGRQWRE